MPKARALVTVAGYDSATVATLGQALDEAWTEIAPNFRSAGAKEAARLKLANIILNLAAEGERDRKQLKTRAVRTMCVDTP
jgi:hypothetical protein